MPRILSDGNVDLSGAKSFKVGDYTVYDLQISPTEAAEWFANIGKHRHVNSSIKLSMLLVLMQSGNDRNPANNPLKVSFDEKTIKAYQSNFVNTGKNKQLLDDIFTYAVNGRYLVNNIALFRNVFFPGMNKVAPDEKMMNASRKALNSYVEREKKDSLRLDEEELRNFELQNKNKQAGKKQEEKKQEYININAVDVEEKVVNDNQNIIDNNVANVDNANKNDKLEDNSFDDDSIDVHNYSITDDKINPEPLYNINNEGVFKGVEADIVAGKNRRSFKPVKYNDSGKIDYYKAAELVDLYYHQEEAKYTFEKLARQERIEKLANDFNFMFYVKDRVGEGVKTLKANNIKDFVEKWEEYDNNVKIIDKDSAKEREYGIRFDKEDTKDDFMNLCHETVISSYGFKEPYKRDEMNEAADLVIAHTLRTKAAKVSFFGHITVDGKIDVDKANEYICKMRSQIVYDPIFREVIAKGVPKKYMYSEYCSAISRNINRNIDAEEARTKRLNRDASKKDKENDYLKDHTYAVNDEHAEIIVAVYKDLLEFNKSKSPSDYMKKLTASLKAVVDEINDAGMNKEVNMEQLTTLHKAALKYYDKRQGIIFSPFTDDGQSRLATVTRLLRVTDEIVKDMREKTPELNQNKPKAPSI